VRHSAEDERPRYRRQPQPRQAEQDAPAGPATEPRARKDGCADVPAVATYAPNYRRSRRGEQRRRDYIRHHPCSRHYRWSDPLVDEYLRFNRARVD
jgi:hypothetical protein